MKKDILNRSDIEKVVKLFYQKVREDNIIGSFFNEVIKINWVKHEKILTDFWENALLYSGEYEGNPILKHKEINAKFKTKTIHFKRWEELFNQTIDELFKGENAQKMKSQAAAISLVMQQNIS
ncbi:MAG TPA: group III truncated hemoglobin [Fluviicola sp.]|nr:group III truncated hemoglobin [Fluviicola sp.]